ncbi:major histocompatibility complex class I-related gene protein-like [Hoplias malabaricus]|uniref:major histocompatibility complex class I-related gene protein-like n=1 Tax=Hoplias malabaricus TaxID=27720 RepID=UPI003461AC5A
MNMNRNKCFFSLLFTVLLPRAALESSHSLALVSTFIKGHTPFPEFSFILMLDDITVGYFDSEKKVYVPRGLDNTEEEDGVVDPSLVKTITSYMHADLEHRYNYVTYDLNLTEYIHVQQRLVMCELMDNDRPGSMTIKNAFEGSTKDEMRLYENKFTYVNGLNFTTEILQPRLELSKWRHETLYYPACIRTLRGYLKKRRQQVKRKVKPRVRLIQKKRSVSGWDGVSCLATGFYPRHINLTILRDGEPVPELLTTGGELLPNGDGTYQMRKNLELSGEDLKQSVFTCSVTHLGLDNKLDVHLEFVPGEPIQLVVIPVLAAVLLVCVVCMVGAGICVMRKHRRKQRAQSMYSAASSTEESETSLDASEN